MSTAPILSLQTKKKIHIGLNHASKAGLSVGDKVKVARTGNEFTVTLSNEGRTIGNYGLDIPPSLTDGLAPGEEFIVFYGKGQIVLKMIEE